VYRHQRLRPTGPFLAIKLAGESSVKGIVNGVYTPFYIILMPF